MSRRIKYQDFKVKRAAGLQLVPTPLTVQKDRGPSPFRARGLGRGGGLWRAELELYVELHLGVLKASSSVRAMPATVEILKGYR
jgi:hypothetical protein